MILAMPSDGLWGDGSGYLWYDGVDYENWIMEDVIEAVVQSRSKLPPIRFDCPLEDKLLPFNRKLHEEMTAHGVPHVSEEFPGIHEWDFCEAHLPDTLLFFSSCLSR